MAVCGFAQTFGGAPGGRAGEGAEAGLIGRLQKGADQCGLAGSRAACDDGDLVLQDLADGFLLIVLERQAAVCLGFLQEVVEVDAIERRRSFEQNAQAVGDVGFQAQQPAWKDAVGAVRRHGFHPVGGMLVVEGAAVQVAVHVEQLVHLCQQVVGRQAGMAAAAAFPQGVVKAGAQALWVFGAEAQLAGDGIGRLEPDAVQVGAQPVRVFAHDADGVGFVFLIDGVRPFRADAGFVQEDHQVADALLFLPGLGQGVCPVRADAGDLFQAFRVVLDYVEDLESEGVDELSGSDLADAGNGA